jgi:hypothetical protein
MMMADTAFGLSIVFMVGCSLYFGPRIKSDRIAMQWGLDDKPTWYAPKAFGVWGLVALGFAVRLLIWAAMTFAPQVVHGEEVGLLLSSLILAGAHLFTLLMAARSNQATPE